MSAPGSPPAGGIELILDVGPVAQPLTGIGHYTLELARRLPDQSGIGSVRFTANGTWVEDLDARLATPPAGRSSRHPLLQTLLRPVHLGYRIVRAARQRFMYQRHRGALFHGTNFVIPDFPGRSVATIHDLSVLRFPAYHPVVRVDVLQEAFERTRERASFLIADSEFTRREIVELLDWPEERVATVHLGVRPGFAPRTPAATAPVLEPLGLRHGEYALCVASIEPRKNISGLIAAYSRLPPAVRRRHPLVLAGHGGWNSRDAHRGIRHATREGWLRYVGYVPERDLPSLFAGARAFVFPSLYEGFGLPVVEAMASGIPVLTSDRSSLPEVTAGAALLVDPEDPEALTSGIRRLLEDEPWRERARSRSLEVASRYTWEATAARTADVYRQVAQDRLPAHFPEQVALRHPPIGPPARTPDTSTHVDE